MACYTPINAFRTRDGISFHQNEDENLYPIKLPCGQCVGCRMEYARQWAVRCVHEASLHENNCFLTLTLDNDHLKSNLSLDKTDFQLFMKRLRKEYPKRKYGKINYYMCGEYGENFSRPHYHACLFNFDFPDKLEIETSQTGHKQYSSEILQKLWKMGRCTIGDVTPESAAYVARYVSKKIRGSAASDHYGDRLPEYTTCSKRPTIGLNWIEKYHTDVYNYDVLIQEEQKMRPPRYYDKFYEKNFPEKYLDIKCKREYDSSIQSLSLENTPERMNVKHKLALIRSKQLHRKLEDDSFLKKDPKTIQSYDNKVVEYNEESL
ncbi:MAG: replication initiator protein [Microvirus sp.]|nr:MAG: replication initiator protein [Microvirus sp.]